MLVQEMQVQFNTRLQRVNSFAFDIFFKEEIDILLNYAQNKFIRITLPPNEGNRKQEGSQKTVKRYDDLQTLVTKRTLGMSIFEANVVSSVLPFDYFDYITSDSNTIYSCSPLNLNQTENAGIYIAYLPFADDSGGSSLYGNFKWTINYNDLTPPLLLADRSQYPNMPILSDNDEKFIIANFAMYELNRKDTGIKVYWEKYGDIYKPNNFIFVSTSTNLDKIVMNVTGVTVHEATFSLLEVSKYINVIGLEKKTETRLIPSQLVRSFIANPYQTTAADSPIIELTDNRILLHHTQKFYAESIDIIYYRKPKPINHYLNVSCEIHESRHDKIVDIAVEAASAFIGNPRDVKTLTNFINLSNE